MHLISSAIASYFGEAVDDPTLLYDETWLLLMNTDLTTLEYAADTILEVPKPNFEIPRDRFLFLWVIDDNVRAAARAAKEASDYYRDGVNDLDLASLEHGADFMEIAVAHIIRAIGAKGTYCNR